MTPYISPKLDPPKNSLTDWLFPSRTVPGQVNPADYEHYTYDANGNRLSLRKRSGQVIGFTYDALNRMLAKDVPAGAGDDVSYAYDLLGRQLEACAGSVTLATCQASGLRTLSTWDAAGRQLTSTTGTAGNLRTLTYTWDAAGNRTSLGWPGSQGTVHTCTDAAGRMTKIKQAADCATAAGQVATFGYDALGRRITRTANNGAPAVTTSTTAYDSASRLASLAHNLDGASAANDNTYSFAYNPASQVASRATANDTVYAWTNHYNVTRAYVSNGLNQYTASGPRTLGYDANGNLTSDNIWTYGYDAENRLTSASGPQAVTLHYDAQGRLYKTIGAATTQFLYDGDALVAEYSGTGALLRRYVHGPGVDEPVLWYEGTGSATRRFFHADAQGSVVAVSDATGLTSEIHSYGPYGEPEGTTGSRFRYTGQIIIPELGMYHYKARLYSPWLGRFLQTDPIGYKDDNNLYAYVANDPVNKTDPSGRCSTCQDEEIAFAESLNGKSPAEMRNAIMDRATARLTVIATLGSLVAGPELLGIKFGAAVTVRVGNALFKAGSAAGTRLAETAVVKAANATLSGLAKGEGRVIAGNGSKASLREGERLAEQYGGAAGDYQKVSSRTIAESSNGAKVEVHAYRNAETGRIYEPKIKVQEPR